MARVGRPIKLTPAIQENILKLHNLGIAKAKICKILTALSPAGIFYSRASIQRIIKAAQKKNNLPTLK